MGPEGEACASCRFYQERRCRKNPPMLNNWWPECKPEDWCGEWKSHDPKPPKDR